MMLLSSGVSLKFSQLAVAVLGRNSRVYTYKCYAAVLLLYQIPNVRSRWAVPPKYITCWDVG